MFSNRKSYLIMQMIAVFVTIIALLFFLGLVLYNLSNWVFLPNQNISREQLYLILGIVILLVISTLYFASKIRFIHDDLLDYLDIEYIKKLNCDEKMDSKNTNIIDELWYQINRRAEKNKIQTMSTKIMDKLAEIRSLIVKK